jgi:cytochrome c oxidase cbb3-type subunit 3
MRAERTPPAAHLKFETPGTGLRPTGLALALITALLLFGVIADPWTSYGQDTPPAPPVSDAAAAALSIDALSSGGMASNLLHVPVTNLYPGEAPVKPVVDDPVAKDPAAAARGMKLFAQFNCVGCHAPNGAGGMGPALSNGKWRYGSSAENIYLTILQGRPNGMPAWGGMLPDSVIWDLVAYVQSISKPPDTEWGQTTAAGGFTIEQVPAEKLQPVDPWSHTEKFSYGQAPAQHGEPAAAPGGGQ